MRSLAGRAAAAATCLVVAASAAVGAENHELGFTFSEGESYGYDVSLELDIATTAEQGTQKQESTAETKLGLVMDVVEHEPKVGERATPELSVTFRELTVDQDLSGAAGEITLEVRGTDVVAKRGAATIVDTKAGKGKEAAKGILREFAFLGEEGTLSVGPSGRVTKVAGPEAFRSFLAAESGAGLWVLETKLGPVGKGETWQSAERVIKRFRGVDLSTNPLRFTVSYTLEEFSEREGRKVARIAVRSDLAGKKGLSAKLSGEALKDTRVDVRKLERKVEGTVLFDIEAGRVIESDVTATLDVEIEMTVTDERTKKEELVKTAVKGTGRSRMTLRKPEAGKSEETPVANE